MESFIINLAGVPVGIECQYSSTKEYCRRYLTVCRPEYTVTVTNQDIEYEKAHLQLPHSDAYYETLALYRLICECLCERDIFLLHGSAIAVDGEVYIFIAPSGTGKSTHTALWRKALSSEHDVMMVNDDKPLLKVTEERVSACGTPWSGVYRLETNCQMPVKAICMLYRDSSNHIEPLPSDKGFSCLYRHSYLPRNPGRAKEALDLLIKTAERVSFYSLGCKPDEDAALTAFQVMKKGGKT